MFSNKEVARYYDLSEIHYRMFWNLKESKSLHYGYWDSSTKNFHQALLNINKVLSERVKIKKEDKVLDAGCGVGGSSLWLAKEKGCSVTGITLSDKQVNKASAMAKETGLDAQVKFEQKDFTSTGYPQNSFTVVWAIESVCHAADKSNFLKEAYRILNAGGRLVMADFFKVKNLKGEDESIIRRWAHGWAVPDFSTIEEFESQMKEAGFKNIEISDATKEITPSAKRLYKSYFIGIIGAKLYALFNKPTQLSKDNVETAFLQYKGLKKNLWKYKIISAVK
jgi:tocopherol O-methyltransferase